jgi:addiction module HigA family antidote
MKRTGFYPGVIVSEEFMQPLGLSTNALAMAIRLPSNRISNTVGGRAGITADTAIPLGRYFGNGEEFWANLQSNYELARRTHSAKARLRRQITPARRKPWSTRSTRPFTFAPPVSFRLRPCSGQANSPT